MIALVNIRLTALCETAGSAHDEDDADGVNSQQAELGAKTEPQVPTATKPGQASDGSDEADDEVPDGGRGKLTIMITLSYRYYGIKGPSGIQCDL